MESSDHVAKPHTLSPPLSSLHTTTYKAEIAHVPIMPLVSGKSQIGLSEDPPANIEYIINRLDSSKSLTTENSASSRSRDHTSTSVRRSIVERLPMSKTFPKTTNNSLDIARNDSGGLNRFKYWDIIVDMANLFEKTILDEQQRDSAGSSAPTGVVMLCIEEAKQVIDTGGRAGEAVVSNCAVASAPVCFLLGIHASLFNNVCG